MQSGVYQIKVTRNYGANAGSNLVNFTLAGSCTYNCGTPTTTPISQYPGFFMQFSKNSYLSNENVVANVSRADGSTVPYPVDVYIYAPSPQTQKLQIQHQAIGQNGIISFEIDQHSIYSGSGQYTLILCDSGQVCNGGYNTNSALFNIVSAGQPLTKRESVRQLFLKLQCREPDAQGWDYWTNYSADLSSIQQQMMYGIEYRTKQQIIQIFQQVLGRAPDCSVPTNGDSELNHWFGRAYNNGVVNLDVVRQGLGVITAPCPVGYICTPPGGTTMCPAGYVCTNVTANCPSGYTCYSATPAVSTPTINTFTITPSPTVLGQSATLSWTTTGLTSCNIDSAGNTFLQKIFGPLLGVVKGANDSFTVTIPSTLGILGDRTGTTGTIELGCYTSQLPNITGTYVAKTVTIVIPPKTVSVGSMTTTNITAAIWDAIREYFAAGGR